MSTTERHSPLGGSVAHRFMRCPGSVSMDGDRAAQPPSEYALLGTAAHELAARCLRHNQDAWTKIGEEVEGFTVDEDMANAVQVYLNTARRYMAAGTLARPVCVEWRFELDRYYVGTVDFACLLREEEEKARRTLVVLDYKHGAGVVVEARHNVQLMYYAAGLAEHLQQWEVLNTVVLGIVQPRAAHAFGPVRTWTLTASALRDWMHGSLLPAMQKAQISDQTWAGPWCRYCDNLTRQCPALAAIEEELEGLMKFEDMTNEQMGRFLELAAQVRIRQGAVSKAALTRAEAGASIAGHRLARARGRRVWKEGAPVRDTFGKDAVVETLKSPAQVEAMPQGKAFVIRWAHVSDAGLRLVPESDASVSQAKDAAAGFTKL